MLFRQGYNTLTRTGGGPTDLSVTGLCFQPKALIVYLVSTDGGLTYTTEGTPERLTMASRTRRVNQLSLAYSVR